MAFAPAPDGVVTPYLEFLINHHARKLSQEPGFSASDTEDLSQELVGRLLLKAGGFNPKRASFNTYGAKVVQSEAAMIRRDRHRLKRAGDIHAQSVEMLADDTDKAPTVVAEDDLYRRTGSDPDRGQRMEHVTETIDNLPPELQDICQGLMEGSANSVAKALGTSRRQLAKAMAIIRQRFEDAGLGEP